MDESHSPESTNASATADEQEPVLVHSSVQFEMRANASQQLESEPTPTQRSEFADRVLAARHDEPYACIAEPSRVKNKITVWTISHHPFLEYDVKMLLEKLMGFEVTWMEDGQHYRCAFRKNGCGRTMDLKPPSSVLDYEGMHSGDATLSTWKDAADGFFERFRHKLASVDLFLCGHGPFNCFLYAGTRVCELARSCMYSSIEHPNVDLPHFF